MYFRSTNIFRQFILLSPSEASLAHIDDVNSKLNQTQVELQAEIHALQLELKNNQDPERMTMIQEMISVGYHAAYCIS